MNFYKKFSRFINCTIEDEKYERYVTRNDIYDATNICPACGTKAERKIACRIQKSPDVYFLYCENCKGCSASHMPTDEYLKKYYTEYYDNSSKQITFVGQVERFSRHIYKHISISKDTHTLKIMDFGGGDGSIAIELARMILSENCNIKRVHVLSVDYNSQDPFDNGSIEFHSVANLSDVDCKYDIVIASAIFEHIQNLSECLINIFMLINKGGYLYARTPFLMPFKRFINVPLLYPMHVHDLGPSFWSRVLERQDISAEIVSSRPPLAETEVKGRFLYTLFGYLFKTPCFLEIFFRKDVRDPLWQYVAGWEIVYKIK